MQFKLSYLFHVTYMCIFDKNYQYFYAITHISLVRRYVNIAQCIANPSANLE